MKGPNLGEFEELVLLTIHALVDEASSVAIYDELGSRVQRSAKPGSIASKRRS